MSRFDSRRTPATFSPIPSAMHQRRTVDASQPIAAAASVTVETLRGMAEYYTTIFHLWKARI